MNESEFKQCPFCGGKAAWDFVMHKHVRCIRIYCTECKTMTEPQNVYKGGIDKALQIWNSRISDKAVKHGTDED